MDRHLALGLAIAGLLSGPILAGVLSRRARLYAALDGFVLATVGTLCLLHLLPHAFEALGGAAIPLAIAGFALPLISERFLHQQHHGREARIVLGLALVGLVVHAALDGSALALGGHDHGHGHGDGHGHGHGHEGGAGLEVTLAILLHRLPEGLLIWWSVRPTLGRRFALGALGLLTAATLVGFGLSERIEPLTDGAAAGVIKALLAGALLHVVLDHAPAQAPGRRRHPGASAAGALGGLALLIALPLEELPGAAVAVATIERLLYEASPAILLGFLGAGLLSLVPAETLSRLMTGRNVLTSAARGLVFGLPLPICSCGVVPIYRGLMRKGVPPAAAITFLVATPELGVDSAVISIPLLGIELTLVRLGAAVVVALVAGVLAGFVTSGEAAAGEPSGPGAADPCGDDELAPAPRDGRARRALHYGFVESVDDLGPWILAGILVAGVMEPLLAPELFASVPPAAEVPLLAAIAAPFYVCASAATPIGAVFLAKGVAAGAVIAFLLTGPATNVTTYGALRAAHGVRTTLLIVAIVLVTSVLLGLGINLLPLEAASPALERTEEAGWFARTAAAGFLLLLLASLLRQGPRGFLGRLGLTHGHDHGRGDHEHGEGHDHAHDHDHDHAGSDPCHGVGNDPCHPTSEAEPDHDHDPAAQPSNDPASDAPPAERGPDVP